MDLLGNGGVAAEEEAEEAGGGAEVRGGAYRDGAGVSSEQSAEGGEEGRVSGSLEGSRGLWKGREGG